MQTVRNYQTLKPITDRNIGKDRLKREKSSVAYEPNGSREMARRVRQEEKRRLKAAIAAEKLANAAKGVACGVVRA